MTQESIVSRDDCREGDCIAFDDGLYVVVDRELMRRIDKAGNLVVIELKRDEDGAHMELQAIRYAAMVSTMTFERAVEVYAAHLIGEGLKREALIRRCERAGNTVARAV